MVFNMSPEEWDAVVKVHLYGVFNCTRPAAFLMRQQRSGRIINMTSSVGFTGIMGGTNYAAAKAGIAGFTRGCALELGKYDITVNAIAPGARTRMSDEVDVERETSAERGAAGASEESRAASILREPEDVAPIVVFLATDDAANINGYVFGASGGQISLYSNPTPVKSIHKDGRWTLDELLNLMPTTLAAGLVNPSPPQPPKQE